MNPIFVSYYTEGSGYERFLSAHVESLEEFGLDYDTCKLPQAESWKAATRLMPRFLLEMFLKYKRPLCYIDMDAVIVDNPLPRLKISEDIGYAFHYVDRKSHAILPFLNEPKGADYEILSGTFFVNPTKEALEFLEVWDKLVNSDHTISDQAALEKLLQTKTRAKTAPLYRGLCAIEESHDFFTDQMILHLQASRGKVHPLAVASPDLELKSVVEGFGMDFIQTRGEALLQLQQKISIPTLVLSSGATINRRPFSAETFEKDLGFAISYKGDFVDEKTIYLTPTAFCHEFLQRQNRGGNLLVEAVKGFQKGLIERIPDSYRAENPSKSPTIYYK